MLYKTIYELENIFQQLNDLLFEGKIKIPVILVQTTKRNSLGWCTCKPVWKHREKEIENYEITICAEYLNRDIYDIMETMIHEMVHLNNIYCEIQDTSNNNNYHNKKYKETAEAVGLLVDKRPIFGWAFTSLSDELRTKLKAIKVDEKAFSFYRNTEKKETVRPTRYKYSCPHCGQHFTITKNMNVDCGDCHEPMDVEEKD